MDAAEEEYGDGDSDGSTDTVVASCELRRRWRERARRLQPGGGATAAGAARARSARSVKQERPSSDEEGDTADDQADDAPADRLLTDEVEVGGQPCPAGVPPRQIKTEHPTVVLVPPFNVKVEKVTVPLVNVEEMGRDLRDAATDGHQEAARESLNHSNHVLSDSDSDFDEPLSDAGSELEGFNDFLEGITKELNDGLYSDLRDGPVPKAEPSSQDVGTAGRVLVKPEPRSSSRVSYAAEEAHWNQGGAPADTPLSPDQSCESEDSLDASDLRERGGDATAAVDVTRQSASGEDGDVERESLQPSDAQLGAGKTSFSEQSESVLQETSAPEAEPEAVAAADRLANDAAPPPQAPTSDSTATGSALSHNAAPSAPEDVSTLSQKVVDNAEKEEALADVGAEQRPNLKLTNAETEAFLKTVPERSSAPSVECSRGVLDQCIQVDNLESDSGVVSRNVPDKMCNRVESDAQTDPPETVSASIQTSLRSHSPSGSQNAVAAAVDESAEQIDKHCEKTFWLLENFTEGLFKEDNSEKTRSVLDSAKKVRDGLNKRHGLPLSQQLNLCTTAVRSMLNAMWKISSRPSRRPSQSAQESSTKTKPTEVVQPFTADRDRSAGPPAEAARSCHVSPQRRPSAGSSRTHSENLAHAAPQSAYEPSPPSPTEHSDSREHPSNLRSVVRRLPLPNEPKKNSAWARRSFPRERKRIIEDGYGIRFLDSIRAMKAVDAVYATAFWRIGDKYIRVYKNSSRLPDTVRKRMPNSDKWQDILSKRLKNELFTGFGIYLESVSDLQNEFLPLNPFHINLLPPRKASFTETSGSASERNASHESLTPETRGIRHASGESMPRRRASGESVPGKAKQASDGQVSGEVASEKAGPTAGGTAEKAAPAPHSVVGEKIEVVCNKTASQNVTRVSDGASSTKARRASGGSTSGNASTSARIPPGEIKCEPGGFSSQRSRQSSGGSSAPRDGLPERARRSSEGFKSVSGENSPLIAGGLSFKIRRMSGGPSHLAGGIAAVGVRHPSGGSVNSQEGAVRHPSGGAVNTQEGASLALGGHIASAGSRHPSGGAVNAQEGSARPVGGEANRSATVWEKECEQFLERIRPAQGMPPTTASERIRSESGQKVPSPATFSDVGGDAFTSATLPARSNSVPAGSVVRNSPSRDGRCLITVSPSDEKAAPVFASTSVPVAGNLLPPGCSDISFSDGELPEWSPPKKPVVSLQISVPGGSASDDTGSRASASDRVTISPQRVVYSSERSRTSADRDGKTHQPERVPHQRIVWESPDRKDRRSETPASSSSHVSFSGKRRRRSSDEDSRETQKRYRWQGLMTQNRPSPGELICEEHGVIHDHPYETFLHLSTRRGESSYVCCPLCDLVHKKTALLDHARSAHGISKPGSTERDLPSKSPAPDGVRSKIHRRRSPSGDSLGRSRASKRSPSEESRGRSRASKRSPSEDSRGRSRASKRSPSGESRGRSRASKRSRHRSSDDSKRSRHRSSDDSKRSRHRSSDEDRTLRRIVCRLSRERSRRSADRSPDRSPDRSRDRPSGRSPGRSLDRTPDRTPGRSRDRFPDDRWRWRRRVSRRSLSPASARKEWLETHSRRPRIRAASEESTFCLPAPGRERRRSASVESTRRRSLSPASARKEWLETHSRRPRIRAASEESTFCLPAPSRECHRSSSVESSRRRSLSPASARREWLETHSRRPRIRAASEESTFCLPAPGREHRRSGSVESTRRRSLSPASARREWLETHSRRPRIRAASEESTFCLPAPGRERHRSGSVESTRFPEGSERRQRPGSSLGGWLYGRSPSPPRDSPPGKPTIVSSSRKRRSRRLAAAKSGEYSPSDLRLRLNSGGASTSRQHSSRLDGPRRCCSREDRRYSSSPDSRTRGRGPDYRQRSRSPVNRRFRVEVRKDHRPGPGGDPKPRHRSPPGPVHIRPETRLEPNEAKKKKKKCVPPHHSTALPAVDCRKMFEKLFMPAAARLRSHLAGIESDSAKSEDDNATKSGPGDASRSKNLSTKDVSDSMSSRCDAPDGDKLADKVVSDNLTKPCGDTLPLKGVSDAVPEQSDVSDREASSKSVSDTLPKTSVASNCDTLSTKNVSDTLPKQSGTSDRETLPSKGVSDTFPKQPDMSDCAALTSTAVSDASTKTSASGSSSKQSDQSVGAQSTEKPVDHAFESVEGCALSQQSSPATLRKAKGFTNEEMQKVISRNSAVNKNKKPKKKITQGQLQQAKSSQPDAAKRSPPVHAVQQSTGGDTPESAARKQETSKPANGTPESAARKQETSKAANDTPESAARKQETSKAANNTPEGAARKQETSKAANDTPESAARKQETSKAANDTPESAARKQETSKAANDTPESAARKQETSKAANDTPESAARKQETSKPANDTPESAARKQETSKAANDTPESAARKQETSKPANDTPESAARKQETSKAANNTPEGAARKQETSKPANDTPESAARKQETSKAANDNSTNVKRSPDPTDCKTVEQASGKEGQATRQEKVDTSGSPCTGASTENQLQTNEKGGETVSNAKQGIEQNAEKPSSDTTNATKYSSTSETKTEPNDETNDKEKASSSSEPVTESTDANSPSAGSSASPVKRGTITYRCESCGMPASSWAGLRAHARSCRALAAEICRRCGMTIGMSRTSRYQHVCVCSRCGTMGGHNMSCVLYEAPRPAGRW